MSQPQNDDLVLLNIDNGIATLTLNNGARRNSLDPGMVAALNKQLDQVWAVRDQLKGLLLGAAGDHFMVGGDVHYFKTLLARSDSVANELGVLIDDFHLAVSRIDALPFPVIAFVQGGVAGAGLSLALTCDMIIAADDAQFVLAYGALGTTPDGGGSWQLPRWVGQQQALNMLLFNEPIDARQAVQMGLVMQCVDRADLSSVAQRMANRLANGARQAQNRGKALLRSAAHTDLPAALQNEKASFLELAAHDDFKEGVEAFLQKRPPSFQF